ncbi:beta-ureidopropionase-like protein [Trifolium pratense]|uniref:Beta-ureidopropionase-like protein n=1 Tax=Trifolium pratense TaxID=57577 RepID=A0A2K3MFA8_TRIPR|nr:beta-ureidopropionase-like protein [Trifolium pratense]
MEKSQNGELNEDASICGYDSLHHLLKENLKPHHFKEVNRLLTGLNCGKGLETITLPESATTLSIEHDFDLQWWSIC